MRCGDRSDISGSGVDATWRLWVNTALRRASKGRYLVKTKVGDGDVGMRLLGKEECNLKRPVRQSREN